MLKKLVVLGVIGFVAVQAVKETRIGSYLRSEIDSVRERAEARIPTDKEIARLRNEVKLLDKDIRTVIHQLAKETVETKNLEQTTKDLRAKQSADKELLTARAEAIKNATEQVTFGNRKLGVPAAKAELEDGVKRFTANQKSLDGMEAALASRERVREGLEKQLDAMKNQKSELSAAVDALEAEFTVLKLQQMESKYQTDDTRLAKIKEDLRALRTKLDIKREELKLMPAALDPTPAVSAAKSVDDIMAPLSDQKAGAKPRPVE